MDMAFSATMPNFLPSIAGPASHLSPETPQILATSSVDQAVASFTDDERQSRLFITEEELQALMLELDQCEPLSSVSENDDLQSPPLLSPEDVAIQPRAAQPSGENNDGVQLQTPQFAVDNGASGGDDDEILAALRCEEDTQDQETLAAQQPPPRRRQAKATKQSARKKSMKRQQQRQLLRSWHRWIATCVLMRQFRAPEVSGCRTALRCQCLELARAEGPHRTRRRCALHQEGVPGREWIGAARGGGIPLLCGVEEVMVPALWAGDGAEAVAQYARWRRGVWMPTRFYVKRAAEKREAVAGSGFEQRGDDDDDEGWMTDE
ncbi:unnamed protein product [Urochloa humidicola]